MTNLNDLLKLGVTRTEMCQAFPEFSSEAIDETIAWLARTLCFDSRKRRNGEVRLVRRPHGQRLRYRPCHQSRRGWRAVSEVGAQAKRYFVWVPGTAGVSNFATLQH